ncbi:HPF/RaiA family ribosome-associated protein [Prosthecobacter sp.]|uniref:HPF/RaiA family ribosome-associated protein n=1 Tax=Prosthecobacter sp. TaxID=1965333 RepID=UPI002ABBA302|nr:HPF/RaiA family ribosome-associated protein [Prosthecobacter sp.]MDZ4403626.1 HPF/RaiA family ribosome-associated protein [Prosthecobacter sp.]
MQQSPQITFRHMDVSPAVEARIREEVAALGHYFNRITSCRVVVEAPHQHHQRGKGFHISIDLHVPGSEIVVNHEPSLHGTVANSETGEWEKHLETQPDHKDIYVSIRDAFAAARRRLEDYARVLRGDTKHHTEDAED